VSPKRSSILLCVVLFAALTCKGLAAQPLPLGPEVRVDAPGIGLASTCPHLAMASDRSFEIAWDSSSFPPFALRGRHFAPDATPTDPTEVRLNGLGGSLDTLTLDSLSPATNGFRALFFLFDETLENPPAIYRQRLDSQGRPVGSAERIGDATTQRVLPGPGDVLYAVSYQARQKSLVIRQIGPTGRPTGPKIVVNDRPIDSPFLRIVPLKGQEFLALWTGTSVATRRSPARQVIRARRFLQEMPEGSEFDVNASPGGAPDHPPFLFHLGLAVAADRRSGGFAVAWTVSDAPGWTNPNTAIHLRFFGASGRSGGPEVAATPAAQGVELFGAAFDDSGDLLLLWRPPLHVLRARLFASTGGSAGPVSPAFQVSSEASGIFDLSGCGDLAWTGDSWLITWLGLHPNPVTTGGDHAIFLRRFQ
jgi:hypothetical protein